MESNTCNLCLIEGEGATQLSNLINEKEEMDQNQQPNNIPSSIWQHRQWFVMCLICWRNLLANGPPQNSQEDDDDDDIDMIVDLSDNWNENWNIQEDVFWGQWREQRITDYLVELNQMITEEVNNIEDNECFRAQFWDNPEFWTDVQDQWNDEISIEIEELRNSHPSTDLPNLAEFLHNLQNPAS